MSGRKAALKWFTTGSMITFTGLYIYNRKDPLAWQRVQDYWSRRIKTPLILNTIPMKHSQMTYIYPLRDLTTDIQKQLESFFSHIGMVPKRIITDFDLKLIGGKGREYLQNVTVKSKN